MFADLLSRLSASQARLLDHACRQAKKTLAFNGLIVVGAWLIMSREDLQRVSGVTDLHRLDRELDHLRSLNLIDERSGFGMDPTGTTAIVTPTPLALQMFARLSGYRRNPADFFGLEPPAADVPPTVMPNPTPLPTS